MYFLPYAKAVISSRLQGNKRLCSVSLLKNQQVSAVLSHYALRHCEHADDSHLLPGWAAQAASSGVGQELKTLRQQRDGLEDQIQRLEASIARAKGMLIYTPVQRHALDTAGLLRETGGRCMQCRKACCPNPELSASALMRCRV